MLREHKSVVIQKHVRGWLARRRYRRTLRAVVYPVLLPAHDGQEGAEEAEDRGPLRGALQEASHWLGEQDHAAAEKNR